MEIYLARPVNFGDPDYLRLICEIFPTSIMKPIVDIYLENHFFFTHLLCVLLYSQPECKARRTRAEKETTNKQTICVMTWIM